MKTKIENINQKDDRGRKHGIWEEYYGNGQLMYRENFNHGKLHGICEAYFS